jgi:hypothetical protein
MKPAQTKDRFRLATPDFVVEERERNERQERRERKEREVKEGRKERTEREEIEGRKEGNERKENQQSQTSAQRLKSVRVKLPNIRLPKSLLGIDDSSDSEPEDNNGNFLLLIRSRFLY